MQSTVHICHSFGGDNFVTGVLHVCAILTLNFPGVIQWILASQSAAICWRRFSVLHGSPAYAW